MGLVCAQGLLVRSCAGVWHLSVVHERLWWKPLGCAEPCRGNECCVCVRAPQWSQCVRVLCVPLFCFIISQCGPVGSSEARNELCRTVMASISSVFLWMEGDSPGHTVTAR